MDLEAVSSVLREHPKKSLVALVTVFVLGTSAGAWLLNAEQCHAQSKQNQQDIEKLIEYQKLEIQRRESEAEMERRRLAYIRELCLSGKLKDKQECAKAGVSPK